MVVYNWSRYATTGNVHTLVGHKPIIAKNYLDIHITSMHKTRHAVKYFYCPENVFVLKSLL